MNAVDSTALGAWLQILFYLLGGVTAAVMLINQFRRKPHIDVDISSVTARLARVEADVKNKQDAALCQHAHDALNAMLEEIKTRHEKFEERISRQVGGIHDRITAVFGELKSIEGSLRRKPE